MAIEDMAIISLKNWDAALEVTKRKSGNGTPITSEDLAQRIEDIPGAKPENRGKATYTTNGSKKLDPPAGEAFSGVDIEVQVKGTDTSDATATEAEIFDGATAYLADGKKHTGSFTIKAELTEQDARIKAVEEALKGKGGKPPVIKPKTITENGTYNAADEGADGYSPLTVNVSGGGGEAPRIVDVTVKNNHITQSADFTFVNNQGNLERISVTNDKQVSIKMNVASMAFVKKFKNFKILPSSTGDYSINSEQDALLPNPNSRGFTVVLAAR